MRTGLSAVIGLCFLDLLFPQAQAAAPGVPGSAKREPPVIETKIFDPEHPPPEIKAGEDAICVGNSRCDASLSTDTLYKRKSAAGDTYESAVKVSWVSMTVSMHITIWLPKGYAPWLKEHEEGHRQIFERVYATADKAALAAAQNGSGRTFTATGKNAVEAEKNAVLKADQSIIDDYTAHACAVWARVNDIYDDLTAHGMNSTPRSRHFISVQDAIEEAFKQYAAEAAAATQPAATQPATTPSP